MSAWKWILGKIIVFCYMESTWAKDACFSILPKGRCCDHYMRINNTNTCKPCPDGYSGEFCHLPCPPPSYGNSCQSQCHTCSVTSCHHVRGCPVYNSSKMKIENATTIKMDQTTFSFEDEHTSFNSTERGNQKLTASRHIMVAILCLTILATSGFLIKLTTNYLKPCKKLYEIA